MIGVSFAGCRGWLHPGGSARGVVMCGAPGFEGFRTYRAWHDLAEAIARRGCTVLRFDYPGTGDSLGGDTEPGRLQAWMDGIEAAIDWLKANAGATDIHLAGLRLGATLAARVAERRDDIAGLALLAPVVSGNAHARELAVQAEMFNIEITVPPGERAAPGGIEVAGFFQGEQLLAGLKGLNLASLARAPTRILLAEPPGRASARLLRRLQELGADVEQQSFASFDAVLENSVLRPEASIPDEVADWLALGRTALPARPVAQTDAALAGPGWRETAVRFGPEPGLVGVLCRPDGVDRPPAALLVCAGRDPHIGWARGAVETARRLAGDGIASLRFDSSGFGDSPADPARTGQPIYGQGQIQDIGAAVGFVWSEVSRQIVLTGSCSGAYAALQAAVADERVAGVMPVNLQHFVWHPHYSLDVVGRQKPRLVSDYTTRLFKRRSLAKILRGQMPLRQIARNLVRHQWQGALVRARGALSALTGAPSETRDIRGWFRRLHERRAPVLLLYTENDPGLDETARHLGRKARWLRRRGGALEIIPGADHTVTPDWARRALARHLSAFIRTTAGR